MPFCSNCGTKYDEGSKFCTECGTKFGAIAAPIQQESAPASVETEEVVLWEGRASGVQDLANPSRATYKLTNQRIIITSGLLTKKEEQIDLVRIKDITVTQSLTNRAQGIGDITIISSDKSTANLVLNNIKKPNDVKELIRDAVRKEKQALGVQYRES